MDKELSNYYEKKIEREGQRYQDAKQAFLNGMSLSQIDAMYHFPRHTLAKLLKYEGYTVKKNGQKYTYNENFFEKIDTEEKAYWLGFLFADGEIACMGQYALRIGLSIKDYDHIVKLKNLLCPDKPIKTYEALETTYNRYHIAARIDFSNKKIVLDLLDKGCYPSKEQLLQIPYEHISQELIRHFVRGFFDGDGSSCALDRGRASVRFLSASRQIMVDIQNELEKYGIARNKLCDRVRYENSMPLYTFSHSAKEDLKRIYDYFYENATIFLERKKKILDDVLNTVNSRPKSSSQKTLDDKSGIKLEGPQA